MLYYIFYLFITTSFALLIFSIVYITIYIPYTPYIYPLYIHPVHISLSIHIYPLYISPIDIEFCGVDISAGDPQSWGSKTIIESKPAAVGLLRATVPEEEARRLEANKKRAAEHLGQKNAVSKEKTTVFLTVLASGAQNGGVRLWDYVQNHSILIPYFDSDKASLGEAQVKSVTFSSDARVMSVLYSSSIMVFWSFSKKRPYPQQNDRPIKKYDRTQLLMMGKNKNNNNNNENGLGGINKKKRFNLLGNLTEWDPDLPALGHPNEFLRVHR